jgi:hypothetical protein
MVTLSTFNFTLVAIEPGAFVHFDGLGSWSYEKPQKNKYA